MQRDIKLVEVNPNPRPEVEIHGLKPFGDMQIERLGYLGGLAKQRKDIASLIVNLYNSNIVGANMYGIMGYVAGESCDTLFSGVILLQQVCAYCESHEVYGHEFVEGLIEQWDFRNKS